MKPQEPERDAPPTSTWGFLTNHAHVLLCVARDPQSRARDIAEQVGITERATQRILADLITDKYVTRTKVGRRNRYTVNPRGRLRHPVFRDLSMDRSSKSSTGTAGRNPGRRRVQAAAPDRDRPAADDQAKLVSNAVQTRARRSVAGFGARPGEISLTGLSCA